MPLDEKLGWLVMTTEPGPFWLGWPAAPTFESDPERSAVFVVCKRVGYAATGRNADCRDTSMIRGAS